MSYLTETSPELVQALSEGLQRTFGTAVAVHPYNTGGGSMVLQADLSQDGRGIGRRVWITRENEWFLGFYDSRDEYDTPGVVVQLMVTDPDAASAVASQVTGILTRLGVTLEGGTI